MGFVGSSVVSADQSTPFFDEFKGVTTGALQTLISFTVPVATTRRTHKIIVSCRRSGFIELKSGSTTIGTGRTGPSEMNVEFSFDPVRDIPASTDVVLEYTPLAGGPNSDIEAYYMGSDI